MINPVSKNNVPFDCSVITKLQTVEINTASKVVFVCVCLHALCRGGRLNMK